MPRRNRTRFKPTQPPSDREMQQGMERLIERFARQGFTEHGRGYVLLILPVADSELPPMLEYVHNAHQFVRLLGAPVRTVLQPVLDSYDPLTHFIVIRCQTDMRINPPPPVHAELLMIAYRTTRPTAPTA